MTAERWQRGYQGCAVQLANFCVLFVLVNVAIGFGFTWADKHKAVHAVVVAANDFTHNVDPKCKLGIRPDLYAGYDPAKIDAMLDEFVLWNGLGFPYTPWVGYDIPYFHGRYLNIEADTNHVSRRRSLAAPEGKSIEVWVMGGSTCFGLFVPDDDTVPSCLQRALQRRYPHRPIHVTNWGRPGFYSSQEVILFETLLKAGPAPQAVVFLDGFNDSMKLTTGDDTPPHTQEIATLVDHAQVRDNHLEDFVWIPMVRLAFVVRNSLHPPPVPPPPEFHPQLVDRVYRRNMQLVRGVCSELGVAPYFFWQPVSFYHWDLHSTPVVSGALWDHEADYARGYASVLQFPDGPIPLGDVASQFHGSVFLDMCHYTPQFSAALADAMASHITVPSP